MYCSHENLPDDVSVVLKHLNFRAASFVHRFPSNLARVSSPVPRVRIHSRRHPAGGGEGRGYSAATSVKTQAFVITTLRSQEELRRALTRLAGRSPCTVIVIRRPSVREHSATHLPALSAISIIPHRRARSTAKSDRSGHRCGGTACRRRTGFVATAAFVRIQPVTSPHAGR